MSVDSRQTTIDIDAMPAGREIDALVAERVMGEDLSPITNPNHDWELQNPDWDWWDTCTRCHQRRDENPTEQCVTTKYIMDYSTSWHAFGKMLQRMESLGWEFAIGVRGGIKQVSFSRPEWVTDDIYKSRILPTGRGKTVMLAGCRAALKAVRP